MRMTGLLPSAWASMGIRESNVSPELSNPARLPSKGRGPSAELAAMAEADPDAGPGVSTFFQNPDPIGRRFRGSGPQVPPAASGRPVIETALVGSPESSHQWR